eukprot:SAG11_NODE_11405_length_762_cov_41.496229_1_plen_87_part_00
MNLKLGGLLVANGAPCCERARRRGLESKKRVVAYAKRSSAQAQRRKKSQRCLKVPIGTNELGQDLVAWLCHKDDLWHSQAHHLAGE